MKPSPFLFRQSPLYISPPFWKLGRRFLPPAGGGGDAHYVDWNLSNCLILYLAIFLLSLLVYQRWLLTLRVFQNPMIHTSKCMYQGVIACYYSKVLGYVIPDWTLTGFNIFRICCFVHWRYSKVIMASHLEVFYITPSAME